MGAMLAFGGGCRPADSGAADAGVEMSLEPSPPQVGEADISLRLTDADGKPLEGADLRVEGNMNHAGMKPSFADVSEVEPGKYAGTLRFTMGGDWFILVTAKLPDGRTVERKFDVPGVKAK
jgi:hypothetical protein